MNTDAQIANLQTQLSNLAQIVYMHQHLGFDYTKVLKPTRAQLIDATTIAVVANQNYYYVLLKGNRTLSAPTGAAIGQRILFEFIQDSTGSRTITLSSAFDVGAFTVTLSTGANKVDFMDVVYNGTKFNVINFVKGY